MEGSPGYPFDGTMDIDLMDELLQDEYLPGVTPVDWCDLFYPNVDLPDNNRQNVETFPPASEATNREGGALESGRAWWIQSGSSFGSDERLIRAIRCISESENGGALVQIWVPVTRGGRSFLDTSGQPFWISQNSDCLMNYRIVSGHFHFPAEENPNEPLGMPGRVFAEKLPEWTPDVRYFSIHEFPRIDHAQRCGVRGTLALPVFDQDTRSCLGVLEIVKTTGDINYHRGLENVTKTLQAFSLRSSEHSNMLSIKEIYDPYQDVLLEISEVLRSVCKKHVLPLAQTWVPCKQYGKKGIRHSEENYTVCVSTMEGACCLGDENVEDFVVACSEHHLLKGQGIVGNAFLTNQPCFSPDITSFSKIEYPLSHFARLFGLRAAVAIRLRSTRTGNADYVLEFFLPVDCTDDEDQKQVLHSLSFTVREVSRSLRVVTEKEIEDFTWVGAEDEDKVKGKKIRKSEKTVSLEILRQHFAGSLKDAAKSIGVCPTTLKRICRQHGISRWPSRKLKKADHSLKKLQIVIDSVRGLEGTFQIGSLSELFPKVHKSDSEVQILDENESKPKSLFKYQASRSTSSSSSDSHCSSSDVRIEDRDTDIQVNVIGEESSIPNKLQSKVQLEELCHMTSLTKVTSQSHMLLNQPRNSVTIAKSNDQVIRESEVTRVKVMYGEERVRFSLKSNCGFEDLRQEIAKRFELKDMDMIDIKYLDDDSDWVLLTCDADFIECKEICRTSSTHAIRLSVRQNLRYFK